MPSDEVYAINNYWSGNSSVIHHQQNTHEHTMISAVHLFVLGSCSTAVGKIYRTTIFEIHVYVSVTITSYHMYSSKNFWQKKKIQDLGGSQTHTF